LCQLKRRCSFSQGGEFQRFNCIAIAENSRALALTVRHKAATCRRIPM
jgi:hypothetical protein